MAYKRQNSFILTRRQKDKSDRNFNWQQAKKKYPSMTPHGDIDNDGIVNSKDCRPLDPTRHGIIETVSGLFKKKETVQQLPGAYPENQPRERSRAEYGKGATFSQKLKQAVNMEQIKRNAQSANRFAKKVVSYAPQGFATNIIMNPTRREWQGRNYQQQQRYLVQSGKVPRIQRTQIQTTRKFAQAAFPMVPSRSLQTYAESSADVSSSGPGGKRPRGRPKGSYKWPGGVFEYRKLMRAQKAAARYNTMLARANAAEQYQGMVAGREVAQQQVQQMQMQQVPQEMGGYQQVNPYMPEQRYQAPYQQQPYPAQGMPQNAQAMPQRAVRDVFRSSGGSPYPVVHSQPLQTPDQTIPQGYTEVTDSFTGRRYYKPLPPKESWISS